MTKNILSIDIDYIMFPCIKLYNDMSSGGENPTVIWDNIEHHRGVDDKFLSYDPESLTNIFKLLKDINTCATKPIKKIAIIEHHNIIDILNKDEKLEHESLIEGTTESYKYNIVNIDFHHDIMYRPQDRNNIINFNKYNCSNWVGYLILKDKIENYTWVKAPNSDLYSHDLDGKYDIKFNTLSMRESITEYNNNFEYIFLCLSPQWFPYKYQHLFRVLLSVVFRYQPLLNI